MNISEWEFTITATKQQPQMNRERTEKLVIWILFRIHKVSKYNRNISKYSKII